MEVLLANPRGFCAGVDRAIDIVNRALEVFGAPIYVRHEVVHNKFVVEDLRSRGAVFVDDVEFDESAQAYLCQVSVPVKDGDAVIGAVTIGIDVDKIE
jgi:4-hydroxy-3-methylbut-2-enyl diphosphate reductase IspH